MPTTSRRSGPTPTSASTSFAPSSGQPGPSLPPSLAPWHPEGIASAPSSGHGSSDDRNGLSLLAHRQHRTTDARLWFQDRGLECRLNPNSCFAITHTGTNADDEETYRVSIAETSTANPQLRDACIALRGGNQREEIPDNDSVFTVYFNDKTSRFALNPPFPLIGCFSDTGQPVVLAQGPDALAALNVAESQFAGTAPPVSEASGA